MGAKFIFTRTLEYHWDDKEVIGVRFVLDKNVNYSNGVFTEIISRGRPIDLFHLEKIGVDEARTIDFIPTKDRPLIPPLKVILKSNELTLSSIGVFPLQYVTDLPVVPNTRCFPIFNRTFVDVPY